MISVLIWWLIIQVLGWVSLPLSMRIFRWLPDRGYTFAKPLGLLLVSYIVWLGASAGFLRNNLGGILFAILLVAGASAWLLFRRKEGGQSPADLSRFLRQHWRLVLTVEILFIVALAAWAGVRAYAPFKIEPAGGEKFMEIAFLNATLNSAQFPPLDPWLSGFAISYYYFGYVMMALITRLSGVAAGVGFDLYDALLFALTLLGAFGVVYNMVKAAMRSRNNGTSPTGDSQPISAGLLGASLVGLMGNLGGLLEALHAKGVLPESFWTWIDIPGLAASPVVDSLYPGSVYLWWWRASRILNDRDLLGQTVLTPPIDEFPFFSFLLGDNHPHVLALPFVLLCIGLALNLFFRQLSLRAALPSSGEGGEARAVRWWNPVAYSLNNDWLLFLFSALLIGALGFLNTWDMPIYLGLAGLAYGLGEAKRIGRVDRTVVLRSLVLMVGLGVGCIVLYSFFYVSFSSQARGFLPYLLRPTRLAQYLVMFGPFIFLLTCYLATFLFRQSGRKRALRQALVWWGRVLLICAAFYLLLLGLTALAATVTEDPTGAIPNLTLDRLLNKLPLGEGLGASLEARLRDPWLLLLLSALLAVTLESVQSLLRGKTVVTAEDVTMPPTPEEEVGGAGASDLFAFLLIFIGLALTLVVDFVYLHDSFSARMNTVFKFYYQGWVTLGCASAYCLWWLVNRLEKPLGRGFVLAGAAIVIAAGMVYPLMAIPSRAGEFKSVPNLDGASAIAQRYPDDWAAIEYLRQNGINRDGSAPIILEAPGFSYNYEGRISAFTGYPAVLGWAIHESQWRGNYDEQGLREPDIATIYTTYDGQLMLDLLRKWEVDYLVLGEPERSYIQRVCGQPGQSCTLGTALRKFDQVLMPVFRLGETTVYAVP